MLRELSHGWLEELTMQTLRTRLIERLRAADVHGRLRVYYPFIDGLKSGTCIDVHSKMMSSTTRSCASARRISPTARWGWTPSAT